MLFHGLLILVPEFESFPVGLMKYVDINVRFSSGSTGVYPQIDRPGLVSLEDRETDSAKTRNDRMSENNIRFFSSRVKEASNGLGIDERL